MDIELEQLAPSLLRRRAQAVADASRCAVRPLSAGYLGQVGSASRSTLVVVTSGPPCNEADYPVADGEFKSW
eukprot:5696604-Alexandrium_andersonii.AAC.1